MCTLSRCRNERGNPVSSVGGGDVDGRGRGRRREVGVGQERRRRTAKGRFAGRRRVRGSDPSGQAAVARPAVDGQTPGAVPGRQQSTGGHQTLQVKQHVTH